MGGRAGPPPASHRRTAAVMHMMHILCTSSRRTWRADVPASADIKGDAQLQLPFDPVRIRRGNPDIVRNLPIGRRLGVESVCGRPAACVEAMAEALSQKVIARIAGAKALYHRLILVTAPRWAGKTEALREVAASTGARLVNLNLELSRRMLDLTERERALRLPDLLKEVVGRDERLVLLDNIEILFDAALRQDPLRLLQGVSRNRTIIASWNGTLERGYLTYATPEHPEHRRYSRDDRGDLVVVCPDVVSP